MVDDSGAFRIWNGEGVYAWIVVPFAIGAEMMMHNTDKASHSYTSDPKDNGIMWYDG
jgi:hypothetical protein